jgi:cbb3-type cytochrome c oxidase subunit II
VSNPKFEKPIFFLLVGGLGCFILSFVVMGLSPWTSLNAVTQAAKSKENPYIEKDGTISSIGRGRKVYIREACWHCHSQFVRPVAGEPYRYGPASEAWESMHDIPQTFGTRRIGPDLSREAGRRSDDWHFAHFYNPRTTTPQSVMPGYPWLFEKSGDAIVPKQEAIDLVAYMQNLGVHYKDQIQSIVYPKFFKVSGFPSGGDIDIDRGRELFVQNCVGCHGDDGRSNERSSKFLRPRAANLVDRYVSPSEAYAILNRGVLGSAMPSFREMPERDLWSLAEYVGKLGESTQENVLSKLDPQKAKKGEVLYKTVCSACHGPSGAGDGPAAMALNPRPKDFTRRIFDPQYLKSILNQGVPGSAMPPFSSMSDENKENISAYVTSLYRKDL